MVLRNDWQRLATAVAVAVAHFLCAAPSVAADGHRAALRPTILVDTEKLRDRGDRRPTSSTGTTVFHDWEVARRQAEEMSLAWRQEPVSIAWTRLQLASHVKHKVSPTRAARGLALVHVAMHDAHAAATKLNRDTHLAVSQAAASVLAYLFPAEERAFDRIVSCLTGGCGNAPATSTPSEAAAAARELGEQVASQLVAYAESDGAQKGWNGVRLQYFGEGRYLGPGAWEPTPPYYYYPPDEPFAPTWRPWLLQSASEFRPTPPAYGSAAYLADLDEVISISRALSEQQLAIAKYWVDGRGSVTPPGHWNQIAIDSVKQTTMSDVEALSMFATLNIALADTFIATWECKYYYWTMRPISAARKIMDVELKPAILTPPFPSYPSGHAAFSGAAAEVLTHYMPTRSAQWRRMADEAANSRLLGGIHFRHDNEDGLALGRKVARRALSRLVAGQRE